MKKHPFFDDLDWDNIRDLPPPWVPELESETDVGYFDDFSSAEDMAKYKEVHEKQKKVNAVEEVEQPFNRGVWVGFTFGKNGPNAKALSMMGGAPDENGELATIF